MHDKLNYLLALRREKLVITIMLGDWEMGRWGDGEMGRWGDGEITNSLVP
jgi:hypothetical protein